MPGFRTYDDWKLASPDDLLQPEFSPQEDEMGRDPLILTVNGWRLEVEMKDDWLQIQIVADDEVRQSRYMRITPNQADILRSYLDDVVPLPS